MGLTAAFVYLLNTFFSLGYNLLLARLFLHGTRIATFNSVFLLIKRCTDPLRSPIAKIIPYHTRFDFSTLIALCIFSMIKLSVLSFLMRGYFIHFPALPLHALAEILNESFNFMFMAILINALFSFVPALQSSTFGEILYYITSPLTDFVRRFIPPMGGIDWSALILIIGIQFLQKAFIYPLMMRLTSFS